MFSRATYRLSFGAFIFCGTLSGTVETFVIPHLHGSIGGIKEARKISPFSSAGKRKVKMSGTAGHWKTKSVTSPAAFSLFSSEGDDVRDAEIVSTSDVGRTSMKLLDKIDAAGQKLKPMALSAKEKSDASKGDRKKSLFYTFKSCFLWSLFIVYRAYRGFFILIPAVFREVYRKMEDSIETPFADGDERKDAQTGKVRFRTALTASILAGVVTISYVVSGAFRVLLKFVRTVTKTSSIKTSFEVAADELMLNEGKIAKVANKKDRINGEQLE